MIDARQFPVLSSCRHPRMPRSVPWRLLAPHEEQARANHSQTLERLAERGGLDVTEMAVILRNEKWPMAWYGGVPPAELERAVDYVLQRIAALDEPVRAQGDRLMAKTDREIVECANLLARRFYAEAGYVVAEDYLFYKAEHPHAQLMWEYACAAFECIEGTDVENALAELDEERTPRRLTRRQREGRPSRGKETTNG